MIRTLALFGLLLVVTAAALLWNARTGRADHLCAATGSTMGRFSFTTWESGAYWYDYPQAMTLAANRQLTAHADFQWQLEEGARGFRYVEPNAFIPPAILKAMAFVETEKYSQADYSVPYGSVGSTLVSHDCGYGLMQVTSLMQNTTGVSNAFQAMVGTHYALNIAEGVRNLAEKWNYAPEARPLVGNSDSSLLENWYYAVWGYNGFWIGNHPLNPDKPPPEVRYINGEPYWDCRTGSGVRSDYPYQELVYGCVANGVRVGGNVIDPGQPVSMPDLWDEEVAAAMSLEHWEGSYLPFANAEKMDIDTPEPSHLDASPPAAITAAQLFGHPQLAVDPTGTLTYSLVTQEPEGHIVTIRNAGTRLMVYRVVPSHPWIRTNLHGGVALGTDMGQVASLVTISVDKGALTGDYYEGFVQIEPLLGGAPVRINVIALKGDEEQIGGVSKD